MGCRRRTQRARSGETLGPTGPSTYEDELNGNYRKIHKILGATNKNKDIRTDVKEQMDERIENHLTIGMNLTINSRFQLGKEKDMRSTFKDDFKGEVE